VNKKKSRKKKGIRKRKFEGRSHEKFQKSQSSKRKFDEKKKKLIINFGKIILFKF